ncbi:MAG: pyridoxal-phosphate dependent enzyme [Muribaculaceae bacterium]|nr:pyridoxal-phosphate dependent enzyme [Muribaculaceae bacterium]
MLYHSSTDNSTTVSLSQAVRHSVAADKGVYIPNRIPLIPKAFFNNISEMSLADIGYVVANMLFGEDIDSATLKDIVTDTVNFDIPLRPLGRNLYSLELYHGPTGSYKDFGARFMSRLHQKFIHTDNRSNILIATRGDAGEAVARAFLGMENVKVFVLYPHLPDKSAKRRTNFTTLGKNIIPVEVRGSFAECMELVRMAASDKSLQLDFDIQTANSLNIARLLPQTFYFFYAFACLSRIVDVRKTRTVISIPVGNLGNLTSGLIAKRMGLPVDRFIVTRISDTPYFLSEYLQTGKDPVDIPPGSVSPNFDRIRWLYGNDEKTLGKDIEIVSYPHTPEAVSTCSDILDSAGRAALCALKERVKEDEIGIVLATSSPQENEVYAGGTGVKRHAQLPPSYSVFKDYLQKNAFRRSY